MKALSVRQPWAWAIMNGKPIENRSRRDGEMPAICRHRGPLLIHASKSVGTRDDFDEAVESLIDIGVSEDVICNQVAQIVEHWRGYFWAPRDDLPRGGIIGRCVVVGHVDPQRRVWLDPAETEQDPDVTAVADFRWHVPGSYGLVLVDREPLPFVSWKGALGLFEIPDDYATRPSTCGLCDLERAGVRRCPVHTPIARTT